MTETYDVLIQADRETLTHKMKGEVEEGRIVFTPLEETNEELPDDPPSRGFKYVTDPEVASA